MSSVSMGVFLLLRFLLVRSKSSFSVLSSLPHQPELMQRFGTVKRCQSVSGSKTRTFCDKPNDSASRNPSSAMEGLVKNLQNRVNFSKLQHRKAVGVATATPQPNKTVFDQRKARPKAFSENQEGDTIIRNMLKGDLCPSEVVLTLRKLAVDDKYPSRRTLVAVAGACATKGHVEGIQAVSEVCEVAFPAEVIWQMYYRHYEAEALWRRGNCQQALKIFQDLFEMHPLQRRKITNMSTFLMRHVINNCMAKHYPKLLTFVEFCLTHEEAVPAANLWRTAFCSDSYEANCLAGVLLNKHQTAVLPIVKGKVAAIIKEAHEMKQLEILQRLMQVVLDYELTEHYPAVFGAYVDHLCDAKDVKLAMEAFNYISKYSIIISAESIQKFRTLLSLHKGKQPHFFLPQIDLTNNSKPKPCDFKF